MVQTAPWRISFLSGLWLALVVGVFWAKSCQIWGAQPTAAPVDFVNFYFGAKYIGLIDIYNYETFKNTVAHDPERIAAGPFAPGFAEVEPVPPALYPPPAFWLLKPYSWLGLIAAIHVHLFASIAATILASCLFGWLVASMLGYGAWPIFASGCLVFYSLWPGLLPNLQYGQLNLLIGFALLLGIAVAQKWPWLALGVLLAALLLKPAAGLLVLPLGWNAIFFQRARKPLAGWLGFAAILFAVFAPGIAAWQAYGQSAFGGTISTWISKSQTDPGSTNSALGRVAQNLAGTEAQFLAFWALLIVAYMVAFGAVIVAFVRGKVSLEVAASAAMCASFLLGPISWEHHIAFLAPFLGLGLVWLAMQDFDKKPLYYLALPALFAFLGAAHLQVPAGPFARLNVFLGLPWHGFVAAVLVALAWRSLGLLLPSRHRE